MVNPSTRAATQWRSLRARDRGVALIMVVLVTAFLSALALGVTLAVFMDRLANGNVTGSVAMLYAADAGVELTAHDLAQMGDWNPALAGTAHGSFTDGAVGGVRALPGGGLIDLTAATNLLNCGKQTACTPAQMNANSKERPWGANNPRWKLFAYGSLSNIGSLNRPAPCYLAVWVGDDPREQDGNPLVDAAADDPGHGIVRVHAEAFGVAGGRRVIEAELERVCQGNPCTAGIRVQSWQELRQALP